MCSTRSPSRVLAATTASSDASSTPLASRSVRRDGAARSGCSAWSRALWRSVRQVLDPIVCGERLIDEVRHEERRFTQLLENANLGGHVVPLSVDPDVDADLANTPIF